MNTEQHSFRKIGLLRSLPLIALAVLILGGILPLKAQSPGTNQDFLVILPHTHWEGAVFKTREEYLEIGLPHILTVLRLLKTHPEYRFAYDQMAFVKPFM